MGSWFMVLYLAVSLRWRGIKICEYEQFESKFLIHLLWPLGSKTEDTKEVFAPLGPPHHREPSHPFLECEMLG